jgi:hypothetical protein
MSTYNHTESIELHARAIHRIEDGMGLRVACLDGHAWITQSGDRRDIVLGPGEEFVLDHEGTALVMALPEASITIGDPLPDRLAA